MGSVMEMLQATGDDAEQFPEVPDFANGLVLRNTFLPEEVLVNVLSFVNWRDMPRCRRVCKTWKRLLDSLVMLKKLKREAKKTLNASFTSPPHKIPPASIPFHVYFAISQNAFGRNLLKNGFGSGSVDHTCRANRRQRQRNNPRSSICSDANCPRFKHWKVTASGGDGWIVETVPAGSEPLPSHLEETSCFTTSYGRCHKEQVIYLANNGLNAKIMDDVRPHIEVSEWYAGRFDCGLSYKLCVSLLDVNKQVIDQFIKEGSEPAGSIEWQQVSHTFKDYGPGVSYIVFEHEGRDNQFWAGYYGVKMAGGSVVARIPSPS